MRQSEQARIWRIPAGFSAGSSTEAAAAAKESEWLGKHEWKGRSRNLLPRS